MLVNWVRTYQNSEPEIRYVFKTEKDISDWKKVLKNMVNKTKHPNNRVLFYLEGI
jgi:hypothetical protein